MMSLLFGLIFGIIVTWIFETIMVNNRKLRKNFWENNLLIFGYHFHHSFFRISAYINRFIKN
ncbi:hypothetical protein C4577_01310 [Candidatus Parcubacteria bacterium]|nr:MAG: hypothetical protein C4577_01310 [Candidatus Parcubacteria bacterium]